MARMWNPAGPGELLREFMGERTVSELAEHIGVARATLSRILNGRNAVTLDKETGASGWARRCRSLRISSPRRSFSTTSDGGRRREGR